MTLLEGSVGVEDLVLLEPLEQGSLLKNLQQRYEHKEIYVSACGCPWLRCVACERLCSHSFLPCQLPLPPALLILFTFFASRPTSGMC